ncbi:hypothetical protein Asp14428_06680 [Actinoplanes sp. NBRC 14428]|nr:hypothetical protein Asp14428_06680 [Actinoplanes sp. NBRC 14428]
MAEAFDALGALELFLEFGAVGVLAQAGAFGLGDEAVADVAYGGGDDQAGVGVQAGEADLGGEDGAVLAFGAQGLAAAHGAVHGVVGVAAAQAAVGGGEVVGDEDLDGFAEQFAAGVAEESFGLGVDEDDPAGGVGADDRVRGGVEELFEHPVGDGVDVEHVGRQSGASVAWCRPYS